MNSLLLLAGLSPLIIFSVIYMIKKRIYLFPVISLLFSCIAIIACLFIPSDSNKQTSMSPLRLNYLANINMVSGNTDKAEGYLNTLYKSAGDTYEGLLSYMRLSILQGDMERAKIMAKTLSVYMEKSNTGLSGFEKDFVESAVNDSFISSGALLASQAMYAELENAGVNPADYGYSQISDSDISSALSSEQQLKENVLNSLQENIDEYSRDDSSGTVLQSAVNNAAKINEIYSQMTGSSDDSSSYIIEIKKLTRLLHAAYINDDEIFTLPEVRDAYILGLVTTEEYDSLIEYGIDSNDNTAIAAIANLYISGKITDRDFPSDFCDSSDYSNVIKRCKKIFNDLDREDYTNAEIDSLKDFVESAEIKNNQPVLSELENRLTPESADSANQADMYIQDSGINSELLDKEAAALSLEEALNHINESDNDRLKTALEEISSIIDNSSSTDNITNLNDYLEDAYKASLPLDDNTITVPESYLNTSNSYVNQKRAMINIGIVNTEDFPEIKAYVSTSGTNLTDKDNLILTDCGMVIEDYTIERVQYDLAQIYLICDNSGSMEGNIDSLKAAVEKFVNTKGSKEEIGIITFDSSVIINTGLTNDTDTLLSAADAFNSFGGTNMGAGIDAGFSGISSKDNSFNVFIVMTDGQDSSYSSQSLLNQLRQKCIDNNVILYTIGLGDVSADYLSSVADAGMGSFIYSSDSVQLEELYSFIHNQLDNVYLVTYKAKDTVTSHNRVLTIENTADGYIGKREYSLNYEDDLESDDENGLSDNPDGISVSRLGISTIIKGASEPASFTILGSGFDKADGIAVSISGDKEYSNLSCTVTNDKKLTVTIPSNTSYGTYNVTVNINGGKYSLKGLSILKPGASSSISFGEYTFTAMSISTEGNTTYLKGNVTMNNYLHFNGDVTLTGSLSGNTIVLSEYSGSYIVYNDTLPGLLGTFFDNTLYIPAMTNVTLYSSGDTYDKCYIHGKSYYGPLAIYDPYMELHSDYIKMTLKNVSFDFPLLNNLLDYVESPISATGEEKSVVLTKDKAGIIYKLESDASIGNLKLGPAKLETASFTLNIDTAKNDYGLEISVGIKGISVFKDSDGVKFGFGIGIKGGNFDSLELGADIDVPIIASPPVSLADFNAGVEGLSSETQDSSFSARLLGATWYGQCDVNFFKLNQIIPGLDSLLGDILDITILSFDDTKLSLRISNFNISLDTTAKLFEVANLGQLEVDLGNYDYKNYLLGIDSEAAGIHIKTSNSLNLDFGNNLKFNVSGFAQIDINNMFAGVMSNGKVNYKLKLFKQFTGDLDGNFLIGIHNNASQFTILVKGDNYSSGNDTGVRVTFTKGDWFPAVTLY